VKVSSSSEFWSSIPNDGRWLTITGKLEYQACDRTMCYLPTSVPVEWRVRVFRLDRVRAPVEIRHK
jgi:hypothetical protein